MSHSAGGAGGDRRLQQSYDQKGPPPGRKEPSGESSSFSGLSRQFQQRLSIAQPSPTTPTPLPAPGPVTSSSKICPSSRPDYGTSGSKCFVRANHFLIELSQTGTLFHYDEIAMSDFVIRLLTDGVRNRQMSDSEREKVNKSLRNVRVYVTHLEYKRKYRISEVSSLPANELKFNDQQGQPISVFCYFQKKYNITLQYAQWPCLQVGNDRPIYLPMEVCTIVGGQKYEGELNERQTTAILKATCQESLIKNTVDYDKYSEDEHAKEFGMNISHTFTLVEARVLPPPELKYFGNGPDASVQPTAGAWNMKNRKLFNGARVEFWICLNCSRQDVATVRKFCQDLVNTCIDIGMTFESREPMVPIFSSRPKKIEDALKDLGKQCTERLGTMRIKNGKLPLMIVILPETSGSYGTIKRVCETDLGIVSQCCQPKHVSQGRRRYLENLALKINVKAGGRNNVLLDAFLRTIPLVSDDATIIFGADVTHPPPGEDSNPSIAAVVASMDWPEITKYRCLLSLQPPRHEIIEGLYTVENDNDKGPVYGGLIRDHLLAFKSATGKLPARIIFYRDGVSEGQFSQVVEAEVDAIGKACKSVDKNYLPPVTFVVLQKGHHTRLFPSDHGNGSKTDKSGNIVPGTVVDRTICHPTEFDFYLCSHAGVRGTGRPTHYHVLWDANNFKADALQTLTHNLCYTYARCTRSVSIVAPAYYAHLGASRARYYMEGGVLPQVKENVKEVMFFC